MSKMSWLILNFLLMSLMSLMVIVSSGDDDFGTDYCPYLSLISASKDSIIYANMITSKFSITIQSEYNGSKCNIPFNETSICGLSIGKNQNSTERFFMYWGYDEDIEKYYVRTVYYEEDTPTKCRSNFTIPQNISTDSIIFKTLADGSIAYGFNYNSFYIYNLQTNILISYGGNLSFTPSDLTITKNGDYVVAVGYLKDANQSSSLMFASVCLWKINSSITVLNCKRIYNIGYHFSEYHPGPKLSIDINDTNAIVIGNSANRSIEIFLLNNTQLINTHVFNSNVETNSVCWLPDGHRIAAVAHLTSTSPWSQSQIQIYDLNLMMYHWPQYVFPNSQQQLDTWNYKNPIFISLLNWQLWNSLIILLDSNRILVILSTEAGTYADPLLYSWFDNPWIWIGLKTRRLNETSSTSCWPGMYKNEYNIVSCNVCPSKTKSSSNATICTLCNSSSFCPLASVDDINITNMIDIHHITSFPSASDATSFEDILLTNMFSIESSTHCIAISPLFWTLIVIMIVSLILLILGILKFFPKSHRHRNLIKKIFRQTDVIGEGELWIGGLMSFSLFVLLIFAFLFSIEYINLYPIEDSHDPIMACNTDLRNAQFDTSLKLLTATRTDEEQLIFDMLDNQQFTLTISFINTNFNCDLLSILEGTGNNLQEPSNDLTCIQLNSSQIIYTSIMTPHEITFKYTIDHFAPIGALYICILGPKNNTDDELNSIKDMEFCRWISQENETIGYTPQITILLTKVVNRTANIIQGGSAKSSGIWQPIFIGSELTDQKLYNRQGEYHRYLNTQTALTVSLSENHFFLENNQMPVARKAEVIFHTVLFVSLSLEMFGLTFLIFKLVFVPLFRLIERKILFNSVKISNIQSSNNDNISVTSV